MAKSAQQEGSPEAAKVAREGAQAAKDQDWNKAIERFRKASELDRKFTQNLAIAYQQRAFSYAGDQRFQDALNDLNESIKINPRDARAYEQRAAIEMKINVEDQSEEPRSRGTETAFAKDPIANRPASGKCDSGSGPAKEKTVKSTSRSRPFRICCRSENRRPLPPSEEAGNVASVGSPATASKSW